MTLHPIDLAILAGVLCVIVGAALYTRRFTRSVADFLSANRCAGRYMLTVADGMAGLGAVTIVAMWEKFYQGGLATSFWNNMLAPIGMVLAMSGFVIYRFRQTRALTLAQFFETRYSRRFRIFAGFLCFVSGVLNYGIFPAVTGRFLVYFLGLPIYQTEVLGVNLNWTLGAVMAFVLLAALLVTLNGGQIAVMVSDFLQGQLANICFLILLVVLVCLVPWFSMMETLQSASTGQSKLNPFDQGNLPDFDPLFYVMVAILGIYGYRSWQGAQGYNASALSPHEAKMAVVLGSFRGMITFLLIPLAAVAAWAVMHSQMQPEATLAAEQQLAQLAESGGDQLAKQLTTTVAMRELLPVGMTGLLAAVMLMASISTDSTYLHSWGSIFVQDVLSPIRQAMGKPRLSTEAHLRILKRAVLGVAIFAWCFSMVFPVQEYIFMYFSATGAIFLGGAGAIMLGGLYWPRGSAAGAWAAMITGSVLGTLGVLTINIFWPRMFVPWMQAWYPDAEWVANLPEDFYLNGVQLSVAASIVSVLMYVIFSLLDRSQPVDFDKLFHRGQYAVPAKEGEPDYNPHEKRASIPRWQRALGVSEEFTRGDKLIYGLKYSLFVWTFGVGFVGMTVAWLFGFMHSDQSWINWWTLSMGITFVLGLGSTVWFVIGGFRDLFDMFRRLRTMLRDETDDGVVEEHLGDEQHEHADDAAPAAADDDDVDAPDSATVATEPVTISGGR